MLHWLIWNKLCPPSNPNSCIETLTPVLWNVALFEDRPFKEVTVRMRPLGWVLILGDGCPPRRGNAAMYSMQVHRGHPGSMWGESSCL